MTERGMTKGERMELSSLIRKRERVMKMQADERAAAMLADFDAQSATIYAFDDDAVWKEATKVAAEAVKAAQEQIEERCKALGIPREFAPGLHFGLHGRGQNEVQTRRVELRRAAKSRIEAIMIEAKAKIERLSLDAQTEVIASGLESAAAKTFLEAMPTLELLMPTINAVEVKQLVDQRHDARRSRYDTDTYQ
ncbi:MAG: hypothetical protein A3E78_07435 [Alphaproteobacteria bacterium RIFCSPHIGHO2_12_FULL_63_12]|nr:MAG: hypothetical protein A3E78_07435 [Alphaproteobacteria bacterium RIFCSPHIGHO2_12_FULL_63_12]